MNFDKPFVFKLCLNKIIHRIPSASAKTFTDLLNSVKTNFQSDLPHTWKLYYEDEESDKIVLASENDYQAMIEALPVFSSKSLKISIEPSSKRFDGFSNPSNGQLSPLETAFEPSQQREEIVKNKNDDQVENQCRCNGSISPPEERNDYQVDIDLVQEVSTIPVRPTTSDSFIYKTILIRNSGNLVWPSGAKLVRMDSSNHSMLPVAETQLLPIMPGDSMKCVLVILSSNEPPNDYYCAWKMIYTNKANEECAISKYLKIPYRIHPKPNPTDFKVNTLISGEEEINKRIAIINHLFPDADVADIYAFVSKTLEKIDISK